MNPFGNDLKANFEFNLSFVPAARAATANGTGIDCKEYEGPITLHGQFGAWTDGTYLLSAEESVDNSVWTTLTPYEGSFTAVSSAGTASTTQTAQAKRTKRYVRLVITETSAGSTGVVCSGAVIGRKKNI